MRTVTSQHSRPHSTHNTDAPERKKSWDSVKAANEARQQQRGTRLDGGAAALAATRDAPSPRRTRAASPARRLFGAAKPAQEALQDVSAVAVKLDGEAPYLMEVVETNAEGHDEMSVVVETCERLLSQVYYRQNMYTKAAQSYDSRDSNWYTIPGSVILGLR